MRTHRSVTTVVLALAAMSLAAICGLAADPEQPAPSRRPPLRSPGERPKVSMFGIESDGYKIVYVFDRSGSMGVDHNPLAAVKAEMIRSLETVDSVHQFQIISYNERPRLFNPTGQPGRLVFGTDENKAAAADFIKAVVADGGTDHEEALMLAIKLHPDVIYWLSDGDDPKLTAKQLERIDRLGAGNIINTIEFGAGPQADTDDFMVKVARQSGGKHVYIDVTKTEEDKKPAGGKK